MNELSENERLAQMPFYVHEYDMARLERTISRLWITILVLIFSLLGTNLAWFIYENQYEPYEETTEVTQTAENSERIINTFVGGDYGERFTDSKNNP